MREGGQCCHCESSCVVKKKKVISGKGPIFLMVYKLILKYKNADFLIKTSGTADDTVEQSSWRQIHFTLGFRISLERQSWAGAIMSLSDSEGLVLKTNNPSLKAQHPSIHVWHSRALLFY